MRLRRLMGVADQIVASRFSSIDLSNKADFHFNLSASLSEKLNTLAQKEGTTLYSVLLAGFYITLSRWTGQNDLLIGTPTDNRSHPDTQSLIGFVVNTVVMRGLINPAESISELVQRTHQSVAQAKAHQDMPFEQLLNVLDVERDNSRHPLFQVMFVLQNFAEKMDKLLPLDPVKGHGVPSPAKFDLSLFLSDCHGNIRGTLNYAVSLFEPCTISRIAEMFEQVLEAMVQCQAQAVKNIDVVTAEEKTRLLNLDCFTPTIPLDKTLHQSIEDQVKQTPDNIALVCGEESLTYAEMNDQANALASHIRKQYACHYEQEMPVETLIALYLDRSIDMVISILAVLKAGGAYVPVSPDFPDERTRYIFNDTQAAMVLTQSSYQLDVSELMPTGRQNACLIVGRIDEPRESALPINAVTSDNLAYVIYTSGTTGTPKGVAISHQASVSRNHYMSLASKTKDNVYLFKTNYIFDVSVSDLFSHLMVGAKVVISHSVFDIEEIVALQSAHRINACHFVPSQFPVLSQAGALGNDIKRLYFSGENLTTEQLKLIDFQQIDVINYYGPTETGETTLYQPRSSAEQGIIGRSFPGARAYVLQDEKLAPIGSPGELYISGPGLAREYLNNPDLTAEKFVTNPFCNAEEGTAYKRMYKTGDRVRWLKNGHLEYLGRNDNQIKIRGYRIELSEIESVIAECKGVEQAVVVARQHNEQTLLAAYLVLSEENMVNLETIYSTVSTTLPAYMVPSSFTRISHVPLTLNGKLNLSALPEPESPREGDHKHREPENEKQRRLCHLWQQEMGITRVGIDDDFFHLGGNSMTAIKLIHRINQELDSNLSLKTIYSHRTVRALSLLENAQTTTSHVIAEALDPAIVPAVPKPDATLPSILPDTDASPLITGAAGFVGRYLLHEQLIHSSRPVYCLLRGSSEVSAYKHLRSKLVENRLWCDHFERRIRVVLGSIDKPKLGMAEEDYAHICESTNVIYHCATYMNHLADYTEMKAANVDSIGEVLSLAATARPKRVVYLSTTGVFNDQEGRRVEEQTDISKEVHTCDNGYLATKWAAEMQMLEAQRRGFDVSIVRLGLTSGATSGHCDQKQWLTQLLHTVNELGCCFNEAFIDASILPVDYVAKAIWTISHQNEMAPIYHLANNNSSSFSELMLEYNKVSRLPIEQVSYPEFIRRLYAHQRQGGKIAAAHLFADDLNALAKNGQPPSTPCTSNETKVSSTNTITYLNRLGFTKPDIDGQLIEKYMHFVSGIRRILSL